MAIGSRLPFSERYRGASYQVTRLSVTFIVLGTQLLRTVLVVSLQPPEVSTDFDSAAA